MWVKIIFHTSCRPKMHENVTRAYDKGSCLCLELADETDEEGRPIIIAYPWGNIFSWTRPHVPHTGMEPRDGEKTVP